ncbi:MAG TPA: glutaredoxin 3 [Oceanospirillales bacterium]|nr:glutaredoxin 3 [Oceanospirillales bacterium]
MSQVILYGTLLCPYCFAAKRLLKKRNIKFKEIRVDKEPHLKQEMIEKSGRFTVPQIFIDNYHVGGYDDLSAFDASGKLSQMFQQEKI